MRIGETVELTIERPAVGGRMIARAGDHIVFVSGAIPGEAVEARVERVQRNVAWAETTRVVTPSSDRVAVAPGLACGGQVLAHVAESRQRTLKGEMLADALRRIGKIAVAAPIEMTAGAADGYRTRARIHLRAGVAGFFEEGSHRLCDLAATQQLTPPSVEAIGRLATALADVSLRDAEIEWAEDAAANGRVAHVSVGHGRELAALAALAPVVGIDGLSCAVAGDVAVVGRVIWGIGHVVDRVRVADSEVAVAHTARAFFQGNRYLLQPLVDAVVARIDGPILDLYAGVGLFSLAAAAAGHPVTAVEGDRVSATDLVANAAADERVTAVYDAVETYLDGPRHEVRTVVVDPPRTGLSARALSGVLAWAPARLVYVSCDPATLARDLRACLAGGYRLVDLRGFDLFPRTGHVEAVATLER
jgi:23S rRNA (uracil1939-C5)-methyltransferase